MYVPTQTHAGVHQRRHQQRRVRAGALSGRGAQGGHHRYIALDLVNYPSEKQFPFQG